MKVVMAVAREARLAGSKSDRVWKGDKWLREYTAPKRAVSFKIFLSFVLKKEKKKKPTRMKNYQCLREDSLVSIAVDFFECSIEIARCERVTRCWRS